MPKTRRGRDVLLASIVLVALTLLARSDASWFPAHWNREFYVTKALVSVIAVVLMCIHMSRTWPRIPNTAQRLRYLLLLGFTVLVASASTAQYDESAPVLGRNVAGLVLVALAIPAMALSIRQDNSDRRRGP